MRLSIWFSGPAWSGVNTAGLLLAELLAQKWYSVLADKEYASIIKGDNNNFFLYIADQEDPYIAQTIDFFFAFDDYSIKKNSEIYTLSNIFSIKTVAKKYKNTCSFGASLRALHIPLQEGIDLLKSKIKPEHRELNMIDIQAGYDYMDTVTLEECYHQYDCSQIVAPSRQLMFWNELLAEWAIASGLWFYAAYPMTPASSIIDVVVEHPDTVTFFQGEDEIAVSMAMLGAKYAGKRAMCGTSWWGFALMSESISFSHQAEIGGVYVLSMRDGPSTWTPTYTAQGDLLYAMNASFGDTFPIVVAPSTFEETYTLIGKALNRSDIYQHPVIFLVDKQLAEWYKTVDPDGLHAEPVDQGKRLERSDGEDTYLRYAVTDDGISPYAIPGREGTTFMASSYEHTASGETNEHPMIKIEQTDKRMKKMETFVTQEFNDTFAGYEIIRPEARRFFVTRGINRYNLEHYIQDKPERWVTVIKSFQPFDPRLKEFFQKQSHQIEQLVFVEMNYHGQMQRVVMEQCRLLSDDRQSKITHHRKYSLYPIFEEEIDGINN